MQNFVSVLKTAGAWAANHKALIAAVLLVASQAVGAGSWAGAAAVIAAALSSGNKGLPTQ